MTTPRQLQDQINQARLAVAESDEATDTDLTTLQDSITALSTRLTAAELAITNLESAMVPSLGAFAPLTGQTPSTLIESAGVAVTGAATGVYPILVLGQGMPLIDVNSDGAWAAERLVRHADTVRVQLTTSPDPNTAFVATVYYSGASQSFSATTAP